MSRMSVLGLYVHVPFCQRRCIYCDFYSTTLPRRWHMPYLESLGKELELRQSQMTSDSPSPFRGRDLSTLYLGGGTPSLLDAEALHRLFFHVQRNFRLTADAEITIEANPDDVTPAWVEALCQTPVNRVSMGVQSLDDDILRTLHRRHTARQALQAVRLLQEAGYHNLSLDLIYGLPGQTEDQFAQDVRKVLSLDVPHLSAYALQFEEGTALFRMRKEGAVQEADEEQSLRCYELLMDLTAEMGMEHYEISNFARPGYRSRHNSSYWTGMPYIGLGAGAHSFDGGNLRTSNCEDVQAYIRAIGEGYLPVSEECLSDDERYNERIMLSLRTVEGLSLSDVERDFGTDRRRYCERMAAPHLRRGTLQKKTGEKLCLTRRGLFVSDDILSDMLV